MGKIANFFPVFRDHQKSKCIMAAGFKVQGYVEGACYPMLFLRICFDSDDAS